MEDKLLHKSDTPEDLSHPDLARLVMDMLYRSVIFHGLYFSELIHQFGLPRSLEMLKTERQNSYNSQINRLAKVLGFSVKEGIPEPLLSMPREALLSLLNNVALNWLADDGIWFQTVESVRDINDARRCAGSCWARYSPFEAWAIREFLGLPPQPGLQGLKQALGYRIYARINVQSVTDETKDGFTFQMNECIVQKARKRKGLEDYPCKSTGLVEYRTFAESIDSRIRCECIGCPPDKHPENWFCAWRFSIVEADGSL